jgi:hypothetical protein
MARAVRAARAEVMADKAGLAGATAQVARVVAAARVEAAMEAEMGVVEARARVEVAMVAVAATVTAEEAMEVATSWWWLCCTWCQKRCRTCTRPRCNQNCRRMASRGMRADRTACPRSLGM